MLLEWKGWSGDEGGWSSRGGLILLEAVPMMQVSVGDGFV
jgi:hypothetical protein